METFEDVYKKWRWLTYNGLNILDLESIVARINSVYPNEKYSENIYFNNYTKDVIEIFKNRNFEVSKDQINYYDTNLKIKTKESVERQTDTPLYFAQASFLRSIFIENCSMIVANFKREELIEKIKRNIIYYHWWDELSFEELSQSIVNSHFLYSTRKLIGYQPLVDYIHHRFNTNEEFINRLLSNFIPREYMIEQMNETTRGFVMFDYSWLFGNEIIRTIRIFENECRFDFNEKIIGSFYNEDLLFREVKKIFKDKYSIISQGSPEWLRPQRFDIFFPDLNIAIEYQGEQHLFPVDFGGKGAKIAKQQFKETLKRDNTKKEKAKVNNCIILYVFPDYDIKNVIDDLNKLIKEQDKK